MSYLELDDIIYNIQKFGGASTYWFELSSRLAEYVPGSIIHGAASKYKRLYSPKSSAKIFHSSHFRVSSNPRSKNVVTVYDLIYEKGLSGGLGAYVNLYERRKAVHSADAIIAISNSTLNDLKEYYGKVVESKPTYVIHLGCNVPEAVSQPQGYQTLKIADIQKFSHLSGQFFLYVGGRGGYKNFSLLLEAFQLGGFARDGISLVCTGSKFNSLENELIVKNGLENFVSSIGLVDEVALTYLYSISRGLVYPSIYEGFGLPPLEAMAAGCPVICSNSSSLPEVVGDCGLLINPSSIIELAEGMRSVLDGGVRANLVQKGIERAKIFNWDDCAKKHAYVYESLVPF